MQGIANNHNRYIIAKSYIFYSGHLKRQAGNFSINLFLNGWGDRIQILRPSAPKALNSSNVSNSLSSYS
tara:strand:+ start:58 stop:264 length:207 start_codon:yes stop_codon:yes gene_type:complete